MNHVVIELVEDLTFGQELGVCEIGGVEQGRQHWWCKEHMQADLQCLGLSSGEFDPSIYGVLKSSQPPTNYKMH